MRRRVYVVAAEYSAPLPLLRPLESPAYTRAHEPDERQDAWRRVFFSAPRDDTGWQALGIETPPTLTDLLASAAHHALSTLHELCGARTYDETCASISDLLIASMPLVVISPGAVNPGLIPQLLRSSLGLDYHCRAQYVAGTSDSGAHAFANAMRIAESRPATVLLAAGQLLPAGYAGHYRIRSVFAADEQHKGLDMMAIGDLLMDALRRAHADRSFDVARCREWLSTVRQRKVKAAESYPAAAGVRALDPAASPGLDRFVTPYFRSGDVAAAGSGAAAVIVTSDDGLLGRIRRALNRSRQARTAPSTRYRDTPVIEVMGVGEGNTDPRVLARSAPLSAATSIQQALAAAADDAGLPLSVYPDSAFAILHDAFPSVELAFLLSIGLDWKLATLRMATWWTNPYGGLLAFGHAVGASGLVQICKAFHVFAGDQRYTTTRSQGNPAYRFRREGSTAFTTSIGGPLSHVVVSILRGGVPQNIADQETFFDNPAQVEVELSSRAIRNHRRRKRLRRAAEVYYARLGAHDSTLCLIEGVTEIDVRGCAQALPPDVIDALPLGRLRELVTDEAFDRCRREVVALIHELRAAYRGAVDAGALQEARGAYNARLDALLRAWGERGALRPGRPDAAGPAAASIKLLKQSIRAPMVLAVHARDGVRRMHYLQTPGGFDSADFIAIGPDGAVCARADESLLPWWSVRSVRPYGGVELRAGKPGAVYSELCRPGRALADEREAEHVFLRAYFAPFGPQAAVDLALRGMGVRPSVGDTDRAEALVPSIFYKNDIIQSSSLANRHEAYELLGRSAQRARGWLGMYSSTCAQHGDSVSLVARDRRLEPMRDSDQEEAQHARREAICNAARFARDVAEWCLGFGIRLRTVVSFGHGVPYQDVNDDRSVASDAAIRGARLLDFVTRRARDHGFEARPWIVFDCTELADIADAGAIFERQLETSTGPGWHRPAGPRSPAAIERWDEIHFQVWYRPDG